ncbi:hypothetical protein BN890_10280 [Bacteroides xylanisolvens SD CC 1b]|uniref:Uncharacterized protein n=1 Tax=Bacteroides xylanisolvens SD CC 1b TaxID=702447 RepID=W6PHE4_9BACE|nr:hypothetical protein BN890_10280 [Bacteroides xylanisolvens SD CC 1b]
MIDIRKDSIYMLILYENDSKVDSVLSILTSKYQCNKRHDYYNDFSYPFLA